jgi:hypothetical protein
MGPKAQTRGASHTWHDAKENTMKNNTLTQRVLRHCAGGRSERGSAIVLVLVAMVLMAILAGSLLQLARFERIPRSESNIEIVIESVIAEILNQATDDLLDETGKYLNADVSVAGGGDEPWDYPWTNFRRVNTAGDFVRSTEDKDGNTVYPRGGLFDDTWLAAHMPDFGATPGANTSYGYTGAGATGANATNGGVGVWRKITSLTGLYLGGAGGSADFSAIGEPNEYLVNYAGVNNRDMNIVANSPILVDSDGDGIGDSRWEWAPLRQIGGTQYVMAVRIVDLSARMDMNVATGRFVNTAASLSRGDSPAEINGQQFVENVSTDSGLNTTTTAREWLSVLNYHLSSNATPNAVTPLAANQETSYDNNSASPPNGTRRHHWTNGASRVSNRFVFNGENPGGATYDYQNGFFGLTDAFELLQGNGINSANTTTAENLMPNFLRRGGQEDSFALPSPPFGGNERNFWFNDPRKHMSPFTGASIAAKPYTTGQDRELKIDVNRAVETGDLNTLRARINNLLTTTNGNALANLYSHLGLGGVVDQLTANIADYIDEDNTLTTVNSRKTGFEALPYITEIYTQRIYDGTVTVAADPTMSTIDWATDANNYRVGYVIEISNPFARQVGGNWVGRPVKLTNVFLGFNGTEDTQDLAFYAGQDELQPGEVLHVYRNSTGNANEAALETLDNYSTNADNNASANITVVVSNSEGPEIPTTSADATVSLHAAAQGTTTALNWAYNACAINIGANSLPQETFDSTFHVNGTTYQSYIQSSYRGVGEGLQMMTVAAEPTSPNGYFEDITLQSSPSTNTILPASPAPPNVGFATRSMSSWLGNETKQNAPSGFSNLAGQQIVWPDSKRANGTEDGRMHWIGDILQIPLIGPNSNGAANKTMANAFYRAGGNTTSLTNATTGTVGIDTLLLPYRSGITSAGVGVFNYPHAVLLLEQLTTYSPASDGENGDGSTPAGPESVASPNEDEVLVPGKINLNTAPYETLVRVLPFPDEATREAVALSIIERRQDMRQFTNATANYGVGGQDEIPGIAYTSALYQRIANRPDIASTPLGNNYVNASIDNANTTVLNGVRIDLNDYEESPGDFDPTTAGAQYPGLADGIIDDREEEIMLAKWLNEVAETRSDVFAAYIVVQGYPADNFSQGADESARLIIIFARANVGTSGDRAVELGRFRIN